MSRLSHSLLRTRPSHAVRLPRLASRAGAASPSLTVVFVVLCGLVGAAPGALAAVADEDATVGSPQTTLVPPPASGHQRRLTVAFGTGFPDLLGVTLAIRPVQGFEAEVGAGAGPFVARLHVLLGPSFLLADRRDADGRGWELELPVRIGGGIGAGASDSELDSAPIAEVGTGLDGTYWFMEKLGLNLRLSAGCGYVVGGPKMGVSLYPVVAGTAGLAF